MSVYPSFQRQAVLKLQTEREQLWLTELQLPEFDVRGAIFHTSSHTVIWDTLSHPRDMQAIQHLLADKPLLVIYSHADWDHVWGTAALLDYQPTIISHAACARRFNEDVPLYLAQKQAQEPHQWDEVLLVPPHISFTETLTLNLGNIHLELHPLAGHTQDCIVGFIPEWGIVLAGDTIETPFPVLNPESDVNGWLGRLSYWANHQGVERVLPSHGKLGGRELFTETIDYLWALSQGKDLYPNVEDLEPFYQSTHEENRLLAKGQR